MAAFSITEAATAGFAVARKRPTALIAWGGVALVAIVVMVIAFFVIGGEHLTAVAKAMENGPPEDPEMAQALFRPLFPAYFASLAIGLIASSIITPAVYRTVLEERPSGGHLKFGLAEVRQFVVLTVVLLLVTGIDAGAGYLARAVSGGAGPIAFALSLASFLLVIFVLVRLSLAGPDTLHKGKITFAGSWKLSGRAYSPLLATFALAVLFQLMIAAVSFLILMVAVGITATAERMGVVGVIIAAVAMVAYLVVICLIYALSVAVMAAPAAYAYRALTSTDEARS